MTTAHLATRALLAITIGCAAACSPVAAAEPDLSRADVDASPGDAPRAASRLEVRASSAPAHRDAEVGSTNAIDDGDTETHAPVRSEYVPGPQFYFVVQHERTYVVLRNTTEPGWGRGHVSLVQREAPAVAVRSVRPDMLPAEVRALRGTSMVLRGPDGVACTARVGQALLLRRAEPMFDMRERWAGGEDGRRVSSREVAEDVWQLAEGFELLVAEVQPEDGRCAAATWAHAADHTPDLGETAPVAEERILAAFRSTGDYAELQRAWHEERWDDGPRDDAHWDERGGSNAVVRTFVSRDGRRFALAGALAEEGCGDFTGGLWALFEERGGGLRLLTTQHASYFLPTRLADVDGDGVPEVISRDEITSVRAGVPLAAEIAVPFFDCPC